MPKICPKCNKKWPDEFNACPLDGTPLVSKTQQPAGFSLNLGDANAISGGVNMCDNHSINTTNHNVINNNFTQAEREKTPEELKHERELAFREKCLDVYKDGIMTSDEKRELEDLRYELGLDERSAHRIMSEVAKQRSERKSSSLSPVHQKTFNNIKTAIISNRLDLVNRPLAQMKAMVQRYSVEEIQFTYYMLQAVLHPKDCVEEYEKQFEDNYWQSFWSSIAYRRVGNIEKSEILVADVFDKWTDTFPQENVSILATVNDLIDNDSVAAKSHYDNISGEHSLFLSNLTTCLYAILYNDVVSPKELKLRQQDFAFYSNNLFADIIARNKKEAEAKAKRLAEEKRKKEEQERKAQAEVRAFYEAELKRKEEEERKIAQKQQQERERLAEEKRKKEEQEQKAQAEIRAYYEAELKRKEEEERKIAQKQKQERERLAEEKRKQKSKIDYPLTIPVNKTIYTAYQVWNVIDIKLTAFKAEINMTVTSLDAHTTAWSGSGIIRTDEGKVYHQISSNIPITRDDNFVIEPWQTIEVKDVYPAISHYVTGFSLLNGDITISGIRITNNNAYVPEAGTEVFIGTTREEIIEKYNNKDKKSIWKKIFGN